MAVCDLTACATAGLAAVRVVAGIDKEFAKEMVARGELEEEDQILGHLRR